MTLEFRDVRQAGESYGGRYLPVFAAAIFDGNKALVEAGGTAVNLTSVAIGWSHSFGSSPRMSSDQYIALPYRQRYH